MEWKTVLALILVTAAGYLLGSVNWGIILTKIFSKKDIRSYGSGNAGMTNVLRSVGKLPALLTFIGDFLKAVLAAVLAGLVTRLVGGSDPELIKLGELLGGTACVLGHIFPVYYGFRGGKGVVASAAMMLVVDWRVFLLILATFGIVFFTKKIISLASVICAGLYPVYTFLVTFFLDFSGSPYKGNGGRSLTYLIYVTAFAVFLAAVVLIKHRSNIGRLIRGEEKPIKAKTKEEK